MLNTLSSFSLSCQSYVGEENNQYTIDTNKICTMYKAVGYVMGEPLETDGEQYFRGEPLETDGELYFREELFETGETILQGWTIRNCGNYNSGVNL